MNAVHDIYVYISLTGRLIIYPSIHSVLITISYYSVLQLSTGRLNMLTQSEVINLARYASAFL